MMSNFDKPFALSMGPQNCGVGALERYFIGRDDVCLPADVKEVFFFDRHFQRGSEFYMNHFAPKAEQLLMLELTTTAFDTLEAPDHVHEFFGSDVTLFCPLRHPVYRSLAVYKDYLAYGIVSGSIESAVEQAPQILYASRYADHLQRWFDRFGRSNIKIMFYEEYQKDAPGYISDLCSYLSIPYIDPAFAAGRAKIKDKETLPGLIKGLVKGFQSPEETPEPAAGKDQVAIGWLFDRLLDDIKKCEDLIGQSLPASEL